MLKSNKINNKIVKDCKKCIFAVKKVIFSLKVFVKL